MYENEYLQLINEKLDEVSTIAKYGNPQERWEAMKLAAIANSQEYCRECAANRNLVLNQLEDFVIKTTEKSVETLSEAELDILERSTADLNLLKDEQLQSVIFRCRA